MQQGDRNAGLILPPALSGASWVRRGDCLQAPAAAFSLRLLGVSGRVALWPVGVLAGRWIESGLLSCRRTLLTDGECRGWWA